MNNEKSMMTKVDFESFKKTIEFYEERTKTELGEVVGEGMIMGEQRPAETFDIFVHPNYPFGEVASHIIEDRNFPIEVVDKWRGDYREMLFRAIKENPKRSIILPDTTEILEEMKLDGVAVIRSDEDESNPFGFLDADGVSQFLQYTRGINSQDKFRVHGSGWCYCTKNFAIQLFFLKKYGVYLPRREIYYYNRSPRPCPWKAAELYNILDKYSLEEGSGIVVGIQHNTAFLSGTEKMISRSFMDQNSIVIPTPEEVSILSE